MARSSLAQKLAGGRSAVGLIAFEPYSIELAAHMGFDWIFIDQMFSALDWDGTSALIRCCESVGLTPVVRVQSNPWLGYDHRIAVDVTRLISLGAQHIVVSNSCRKEIEECVEAARNWHKKYWVHVDDEGFGSRDSSSRIEIIPQPECKRGLSELLDTLSIPGVHMAFIGTTDPSIALSGSTAPNFYAKELWGLVDQVRSSHQDVVLIANTSWFKTMDDMIDRVKHMEGHGVRMPLLQTAQYLMQVGAGPYLEKIRAGDRCC